VGFISSFATAHNTTGSSLVGTLSLCKPQNGGTLDSIYDFHCGAVTWLRNYASIQCNQHTCPPLAPIAGCACYDLSTSQPVDVPANLAQINLFGYTVISQPNTCGNAGIVGNSTAHEAIDQWTLTGSIPAVNFTSTSNLASLSVFGGYCDKQANSTTPFVVYQFILTTVHFDGLNNILGFFIGIVLLIGALGIYIGATFFGTGATFAVNNPQATRLMQSMGIFLVVWFPLYSEFGGWIQSVAGLGGDTVITIGLFIMGFYGLWAQTTGGTSPS